MSETNKDVAVAFYKAVTEGRIEDAFRLYAVPTRYRQHNPLIEDGMEGLRKIVTWLTDARCACLTGIVRDEKGGTSMIVRYIEAEGWGCFANAIEVGPLSEGVNVLYGPNGTGKSTLLETIIRGLFDSYAVGGIEALALRPWGRYLTPKVRIEFAHGGVEYRLKKRFLDKPSALLEVREDGGWTRFAEDEAAPVAQASACADGTS